MSDAAIRPIIRVEAWAQAADGVSMSQLVSDLRAAGHQILALDPFNRRAKVLDRTE